MAGEKSIRSKFERLLLDLHDLKIADAIAGIGRCHGCLLKNGGR